MDQLFKNVMDYDPAIAADFIKPFEGFRAEAYICPAGIWTIGYGHTRGVHPGQTVTKEKADELLKNDLVHTQQNLDVLVKVPVTRNQFIALMSFVYNFGLTKCRKYTLFKKINARDEDGIREWWPKYCNPDNPVITKGLKARRLKELNLFFSQ